MINVPQKDTIRFKEFLRLELLGTEVPRFLRLITYVTSLAGYPRGPHG